MKRSLAACVLIPLTTFAISCASKHPSAPLAGAPMVEVYARTASDAVNVLAATWPIYDCPDYLLILTNDFTFAFAAEDSSGGEYRSSEWGLAEEATAIGHFLGAGGTEAPLRQLFLSFDGPLVATADPRPGRANRWHRVVAASVSVGGTRRIEGVDYGIYFHGPSLFYLVRGDSADVPLDRGPGSGRDSTRWYIQSWVETSAEVPQWAVGTLGAMRTRWLPASPVAGRRALAPGTRPFARR